VALAEVLRDLSERRELLVMAQHGEAKAVPQDVTSSSPSSQFSWALAVRIKPSTRVTKVPSLPLGPRIHRSTAWKRMA